LDDLTAGMGLRFVDALVRTSIFATKGTAQGTNVRTT
jgi:hypothetical protein